MSIVVRDMQTNEIVLLSKGADSIMFDLISTKSQDDRIALQRTQDFVNIYAEDGLRTLVLARRVLDDRTYREWNKEQEKASSEVIDREEKLDAVNAKIEHELTLVGSTAIEDKLQEDVPETIEALKEIGVKVWVLTGDKIETAINIGYSAKLLTKEIEQHIVKGTDINII